MRETKDHILFDPVSFHRHDCCFSAFHKTLTGGHDASEILLALTTKSLGFTGIRQKYHVLRTAARKHIIERLREKYPTEEVDPAPEDLNSSAQSKILLSLVGKKRPRSEVISALTKVREMNRESVKRVKTQIESFRLQVKGVKMAEDIDAAEFDAQILEDAEKAKAGEFTTLDEMIAQAEQEVAQAQIDGDMPEEPLTPT